MRDTVASVGYAVVDEVEYRTRLLMKSRRVLPRRIDGLIDVDVDKVLCVVGTAVDGVELSPLSSVVVVFRRLLYRSFGTNRLRVTSVCSEDDSAVSSGGRSGYTMFVLSPSMRFS